MYNTNNNNNIFNSNYDTFYNTDNIYSSKEEEVHDEVETKIRLGFIRKVYGILSIQLLITTIFCIFSMTSSSFQKFFISNIGLFWLTIFLIIIIPFIIICCPNVMRKTPINYIILFIFTFSESYIVGFICSYYSAKIVFMATFMTFTMVFTLTIYAITTKNDFTMQGGLLFILGSVFALFIIFGFFTNNKIFHVILSLAGVILFSFYLIYDTQLIIGNRKELIEVDDYILGSFILYTDIIYIFTRLLQILQFFEN